VWQRQAPLSHTFKGHQSPGPAVLSILQLLTPNSREEVSIAQRPWETYRRSGVSAYCRAVGVSPRGAATSALKVRGAQSGGTP
jgi:hypothetical protein